MAQVYKNFHHKYVKELSSLGE